MLFLRCTPHLLFSYLIHFMQLHSSSSEFRNRRKLLLGNLQEIVTLRSKFKSGKTSSLTAATLLIWTRSFCRCLCGFACVLVNICASFCSVTTETAVAVWLLRLQRRKLDVEQRFQLLLFLQNMSWLWKRCFVIYWALTQKWNQIIILLCWFFAAVLSESPSFQPDLFEILSLRPGEKL